MSRVGRSFLLVVSILNGVAGLVCGVLFIAIPDGRLMRAEALLPVVRGLPLPGVFLQDFFWVGIAMLLVLGIPNLTVAVMLLRKSENQYLVALFASILLVLWCGFELIFMFNILAVSYFIIGLISILCSILLLRRAPASA